MIVIATASLLYLLVTLVIGLRRTRGIDYRNYVAAPNKTGTLALTLSLVGTLVGGGMFLGVAQIGYEAGLTGVMIGIAYFAAYLVVGVLAPYMREQLSKAGADTVGSLVEQQYGRRCGILFAGLNAIVFFMMLGAQYIALADFIGYLFSGAYVHIVILVACVLVATSVVLYSAFGGLPKDIATDVFQVVVICVGTLPLLWVLIDPAVISGMRELPFRQYYSGMGYGPLFTVMAVAFLIPGLVARFDYWQRARTAKDDKSASRAFLFAGIGCLLFYSLFTVLGMAAKAAGEAEGQTGLLALLKVSLSPQLEAVVLVAFLAALMSSADTFLGVAAINFASLFGGWPQGQGGGAGKLRGVRFATVGLGVGGLAMALLMRNLVDLFVGAISIVLVFAPPVLALLFDHEPSKKAAFWGPLAGTLVLISTFYFAPKTAFVPAVLISVAVYFVVRAADTEREKLLHRP